MVVEGIHVEDIFELVSLVLSLIISWTFRILAHEEDQYTDFFINSTQTVWNWVSEFGDSWPFLVLVIISITITMIIGYLPKTYKIITTL